MIIEPGQVYKVVEFTHGLAILSERTTVKGGHDHILADKHALVEFLIRYLEAREDGMSITDAHAKGLKNAIVIPTMGVRQ